MPRLSTLKAVRPTLMAELTAWSVACPAAAPYLHWRSDWMSGQKEGKGEGNRISGGID